MEGPGSARTRRLRRSPLPGLCTMHAPLSGYVTAARLRDVRPGTMRRIVVRDTPLVLVRVGNELHALADECLCSGEALSAGMLAGTVIECAVSRWRYDVATGAVAGVPSLRLDVHDVRVVRGCVAVSVVPRVTRDG